MDDELKELDALLDWPRVIAGMDWDTYVLELAWERVIDMLASVNSQTAYSGAGINSPVLLPP